MCFGDFDSPLTDIYILHMECKPFLQTHDTDIQETVISMMHGTLLEV
jgi:hypothetical protein